MPASVLLVDNDADSIAIYSLILEHHGYEVMVAQDAAVGFTLARERRPDLVVVELYMPFADGGSMHERLMADESTAGIPLILLDSIAAWGDELPRSLHRATRLTKPCEPSRLLMEVERLLGPGLEVELAPSP